MSDSGEKTEEATPRQKQKARERGEVAKSKDLTGSVLLAVAALVLASQIDVAARQIGALAKAIFATAGTAQLTQASMLSVLGQAALQAGLALLPLLAAIFATAAFVSFVQVGALVTLDPFKPKIEKFNPINGIKKMLFSMQAYVELLKSAAKILIVGFIFYQVIRGELPTILRLGTQPPEIIARQALRIAGKGLTRAVLFYMGIAVLDFFYQRWQHSKNLRMTREQVKQEYKEQEGDPHSKAHRKHLHQEILTQSMLHKARKANVMVTNPDHIACALRYDPGEEDAPRLLGKGTGYLAEKLKEIAREEDIPIVRDISLAHALYKLEEDDQIPEELFDAVAEVLKWVEVVLRAQGEVPVWLQPREEGEAAEENDAEP
jgi:flagellar biosynthetic protein FlhB